MNITTAAWRLNRCNHTSTSEPFLHSKPLCWIFCWPAFCIIVQQMDRAENKKNPFQLMCTFIKSCLTRTKVASLTSHFKPKDEGCLQWPHRDLPVIGRLSGEFNIRDRSNIFHGLQLFRNCFWLYYAQLSACPPLELPPLHWRLQRAWSDLTLTCSHKQAMSNLTRVSCSLPETRNPKRQAKQTF